MPLKEVGMGPVDQRHGVRTKACSKTRILSSLAGWVKKWKVCSGVGMVVDVVVIGVVRM